MNWEPSCFQSACVQDLSCAVTWQKDYKGSFKRACVHPGWTSCLTPFRALSELPDAHTASSHASWKQVWRCFQWNKVFLNTESTVSASSVRLSCLCDRGQGPPPLPVWPQWWMNCCWLRAGHRDWTISVPVQLLSVQCWVSVITGGSCCVQLTQGCCFRRRGAKRPLLEAFFVLMCMCKIIHHHFSLMKRSGFHASHDDR